MKPNIIIRMGAAHWDAYVRGADGKMVHFDFLKMDRKQRSNFHRELMNAFRASRK
jgi:hypothetical protein